MATTLDGSSDGIAVLLENKAEAASYYAEEAAYYGAELAQEHDEGDW